MSTESSMKKEIQQSDAATADPAQAWLAAVNADPKWERRRRVIAALEAYKFRLDARVSLRDRYDVLCARLYSGRSSRITGMPTNHDQFAADDRFAEMLDEKMALERAMAAEEAETRLDDVKNALDYIDSQSRMLIKQFYLDDNPRKALKSLMSGLGYSSPHVYEIRNSALDKLFEILYAEE